MLKQETYLAAAAARDLVLAYLGQERPQISTYQALTDLFASDYYGKLQGLQMLYRHDEKRRHEAHFHILAAVASVSVDGWAELDADQRHARLMDILLEPNAYTLIDHQTDDRGDEGQIVLSLPDEIALIVRVTDSKLDIALGQRLPDEAPPVLMYRCATRGCSFGDSTSTTSYDASLVQPYLSLLIQVVDTLSPFAFNDFQLAMLDQQHVFLNAVQPLQPWVPAKESSPL